MNEPDGYTTKDVAAIIQVSYWRLHSWAAAGLLEPSLRGPERQRLKPAVRVGRRQGSQNRLYGFDDLLAARLVRELRSRGLSLQKIRRAVVALRRQVGDRPLQSVVNGQTVLTLDGRGRLAIVEAEQAWSLSSADASLQGVIRLGRDVRELIEDWQRTHAGGAVGPTMMAQISDVNRKTRRAMQPHAREVITTT